MIDDEVSIGRHSRCPAHWVRVPDLRTEERSIEALLSLARTHNIDGWVVFPTRDETVAAPARHRADVLEHLRIPAPDWSVTRCAWDKRSTYSRTVELGTAVPRTSRVSTEDLQTIDADPPSAINAGDQAALPVRNRVQGLARGLAARAVATLPPGRQPDRAQRGHRPGACPGKRSRAIVLLVAWTNVSVGRLTVAEDVQRNASFHDWVKGLGRSSATLAASDDGEARFGMMRKPVSLPAASSAARYPCAGG